MDLWNCFDDGLCNEFAGEVHTYGMCLKDSTVSIDVDDESRKLVSFAVHKTVCVVLRVGGRGEVECFAELVGGGKTGAKEVGVDFRRCEGEYSDGDGTDFIMSDAEEVALCGTDGDEFAVRRLWSVKSLDGT